MASTTLSLTANTPNCFRAFVGQKMRGYFMKDGDSYLIFQDGRALVLHHATGAYWVAAVADVERELDRVAERLRGETAALGNVLALAGAADKPRRSAR